jgi:hypothetical protein
MRGGGLNSVRLERFRPSGGGPTSSFKSLAGSLPWLYGRGWPDICTSWEDNDRESESATANIGWEKWRGSQVRTSALRGTWRALANSVENNDLHNHTGGKHLEQG